MKLKAKLLAGVSALAILSAPLAACGDDADEANNTVVVENHTTNTVVVDENAANAADNEATPCETAPGKQPSC